MLRVSHWLIPVLRGSGITSMSYASGFASILGLQSAPEFRISEFVSRRPRIGVPSLYNLGRKPLTAKTAEGLNSGRSSIE